MGGTVDANSTELLGTGTSVKFDVPFAGIYGVATRGGFFSDLTIRHDWYHNNVTNFTANLNNADLTGYANAVNGSAGYHFDLGMLSPGLFVEPSAGLSLSWTKFNGLPTNLGQQAQNIPPGLIGFSTLQSDLARAGVRFGTTTTINQTVAVQPFATMSVWRELAGMSQQQFSQAGIATTDNLSLTRVGTFYQVGAGVGWQVLHTGWVGFARGDVQFGQLLDGASIVGGVRYTFAPPS
jgi:outer membrane autotransporter protein